MKRAIHKLIVWYLRRCGGAFHNNPYGPAGRYVVLMSDEQYHRYAHIAEHADPGEDLLAVHRAMQAAKDDAP